MSMWTTINATVIVDFGAQTDYFIREFFTQMKDARYTLGYDPKRKGEGYEITGSELNAVVVAEPLRNHVMDGRDRYWHGQTWAVTVTGNLRDREFHETVAEWQRFAWKLAWFVHHDCKRVSRGGSEFDNGMAFPKIVYYNVDIVGFDKRYHRCSIKSRDFVMK